MIISYAGYSTLKCTCNGRTTHLSKTCKFLLKCLYVMDEKVTQPFPCLEPSLTPSHLPKPYMRKIIIFKTKTVVLENTLSNVGKNMGQPSEANVLENLPKQSWSSSEMICWTVSQPHSLEVHLVKFLSQPCSFFRKLVSCTHTYYSTFPSAYEMQYAILP